MNYHYHVVILTNPVDCCMLPRLPSLFSTCSLTLNCSDQSGGRYGLLCCLFTLKFLECLQPSPNLKKKITALEPSHLVQPSANGSESPQHSCPLQLWYFPPSAHPTAPGESPLPAGVGKENQEGLMQEAALERGPGGRGTEGERGRGYSNEKNHTKGTMTLVISKTWTLRLEGHEFKRFWPFPSCPHDPIPQFSHSPSSLWCERTPNCSCSMR